MKVHSALKLMCRGCRVYKKLFFKIVCKKRKEIICIL